MNIKNADRVQIFRRHKWSLLAFGLAFTLAAVSIAQTLPADADDIRRSACLVDGRAQLCLVGGGDTLVLHTDSVSQQGVWVNRHWWWPSCGGRVLTIGQGTAPTHHANWNDTTALAAQLRALADSLGRLLDRKTVERKELDYYLRSHGVQDEGYTKIAHYADQQDRETDSLSAVHRRLKAMGARRGARMVRRYMLRVSWFDSDGTPQHAACMPLITPMGRVGEPVEVQTDRALKPWGVYAVSRMPWTAPRRSEVVTACVAPADTTLPHRTLLVHGHRSAAGRHDLPALFAPDGSPVFNPYGRYVGLVHQQLIKN